MVRWPAAPEAASYAREHPSLSLGLHVDLGERVFCAGEWVPLYTVVSLQDTAAIAAEVSRQLDLFYRLMGCGPSHIDSHQHVHLREPVNTILTQMARDLGIALRHCSPDVCYRGNFYGQTAEGAPLPNVISVDGLDTHPGDVASGVHGAGMPSSGAAATCDTMYRHERLQGTQSPVRSKSEGRDHGHGDRVVFVYQPRSRAGAVRA